ncbi:hypothetical protein Z043_110279 [Scleropages formosus]|uniref:ZP domain-containing protein n=1 Tax=Scleropages formosus TaxID=113540 RepID=A0A0P7X8R5_SCLFO|nr:hypothetical protein Z043_110279 [Scleropages formosus]
MQWRSWASLFCLLLLGERTAVCRSEAPCPVSPVGAHHPVQGLLESFGAGLGCAARESGAKETHVISVGGGGALDRPSKVTVILRPLFYSRPSARPVMLVLSSQHAVSWWLEGERLPPSLGVLVQVSAHSSVQSRGVALQVEQMPSLPWQPRRLLRWGLKHHSSISSLNHAVHANRVYLRLGEDPTMPSVCQLQPLFLSHNYLTSVLQPQEVRGCTPGRAGEHVEVHIIRLTSAGSGICGSLQVEVPVSVLPPTANAGWYELVLILSSAVPVNWALSASGLQGHISVYSSNTVSPLYPSEPDLTMTSTLNPNLHVTRDLVAWAKQQGFPAATSYTEADLANRFVIRLARAEPGRVPSMHSLAAWSGAGQGWGQDSRLRQWLRQQGSTAYAGVAVSEAASAQCHDGQLSVAVDAGVLQVSPRTRAKLLPSAVSGVTLRDPRCQAQFNGTHFLLVFPVISCGTDIVLEGQPRGVRYKNMVLVWKERSLDPDHKDHNGKGEEQIPLIIQISCFALVPRPSSSPLGLRPPPQGARGLWAQQGARGPGVLDGPTSTPLLSLQLFVTEAYKQRETGPCVIAAKSRLYVEVSAKGTVTGAVEVWSCVVSPLSDPQAAPGWTVIQDGCSYDPTLTLITMRQNRERGGRNNGTSTHSSERTQEAELDVAGRGTRDKGEREPAGTGNKERRRKTRKKGGKAEEVEDPEKGAEGGEEMARPPRRLRFSFVLRPVYNNSIQFLHCRLRHCDADSAPTSNSTPPPPTGAAPLTGCQEGLRIPALISPPNPSYKKCYYRTLFRPMVVTEPVAVSRSLVPSAGPGFDTGSVVGIVFAAFLMGISVMGALWCIYSHTGIAGMAPVPRRSSPMDTAEQTSTSNSPVLLEQSSSTV